MDALSDVLRAVRLTGAVFFDVHASAPWVAETPPGESIVGTIFPGTWEFVVRGIFDGVDETKVTRQMMFHWEYLNETVRKTIRRRADQVGLFVVGIDNPDNAASISRSIDAVFKNSLAETLTETEQAFQLGFVAMSNEIIAAIRILTWSSSSSW